MADHPTVMSPAEIEAWRRGDKTQHRVLLDPQPSPDLTFSVLLKGRAIFRNTHTRRRQDIGIFAPGDRLVVRTFKDVSKQTGIKAAIPVKLAIPITPVRIERVQDISKDDARAEGWTVPDFISWFQEHWNERHGPDAWERNEWVVVLALEKADDPAG